VGESPTQSTQPSAVFFHEAFASPGAYPASSELFALKPWRTETTVFPLTTTPASSPGPLSLRSRRAAVPGIFGAYLRAARVGAGAVSSVIFSVVLDLGLSDNGAGTKILVVLLIYTALQLGLLLFFLFDILRVGLWRRKSPNLNGWIALYVAIGVIVWGAICTCNIVMML